MSVETSQPSASIPRGRSVGGAISVDRAPDEPERLHERARDARVEDVADDRDVQPLEAPERLLERVQVEQRLRRMLVLPVPGVDDVRVRAARDELRRPDRRVPHDDDVRLVGGERQGRVLQGLALVDRRSGGAERHRVRGEALGGELEARESASRGLVEQVHDRAPPQRRELLHLAVERGRERTRGLEEPLDVVALEIAHREQVPPGRRGNAQLSHCRRPRSRPGAGRRRPRPPRRARPGSARSAPSAGSSRRSRA